MNFNIFYKTPGKVISGSTLKVNNIKRISKKTIEEISDPNTKIELIKQGLKINIPKGNNSLWEIKLDNEKIWIEVENSENLINFINKIKKTNGGVFYLKESYLEDNSVYIKVLFKEALILSNNSLPKNLEIETNLISNRINNEIIKNNYTDSTGGWYLLPQEQGFNNGFFILPLDKENIEETSALNVIKENNRYIIKDFIPINIINKTTPFYFQIPPSFVYYANHLDTQNKGSINKYIEIWEKYTEDVEKWEKEIAKEKGKIKYNSVNVQNEYNKRIITFKEVDLSEFRGTKEDIINSQFKINDKEINLIVIEYNENSIKCEANTSIEIPENGELHISTSGSEKVAKRRKKAINILVTEQAKLNELPKIIENGPDLSKKQSTKIFFNYKIKKKLSENFGFEFSDNQLEIIKNAIQTPDIYLLQGPPGTGKTTIIKAITYVLIENNKKVGISSQQNDALDNILRNFPQSEIPPIRILSYSTNEEAKKRKREIGRIFNEWLNKKLNLLNEKYEKIPGECLLKAAYYYIEKIKKIKSSDSPINELSKLLDELEKFPINLNLIDAKTLLKKWEIAKEQRKIIAEKVLSKKDLDKLQGSELKDIYKKLYQEECNYLSINEIKEKIEQKVKELNEISHPCFYLEKLEKDIESYGREILMNEKDENLFMKSLIYEFMYRIKLIIQDINDEIEQDGKNIENIIMTNFGNYSEVIAATCQMIDLRLEDKKDANDLAFDYIIIDEAARANPADLLIPMTKGEKIILVGDHMQLPHYLENEVIEDKISEEKEILKESLFKKLFEKCKAIENTKVPRYGILKEERRMHPELSKFVFKNFYPEEKIESLAKREERVLNDIGIFNDRPSECAIFVDVPANLGREIRDENKSIKREAEANAIVSIIEKLSTKIDFIIENGTQKLAVASFYSAQKDLIREKISSSQILSQYQNLEDMVTTVDSFQGKEADIFILSATRSGDNLGFLNMKERLCVAFSRARKLMIIVGNLEKLMYNDYIKKFYDELCKKKYIYTQDGNFILDN